MPICNEKNLKSKDDKYICNSDTGRWVLKSGKIGQIVLNTLNKPKQDKKNNDNYIYNPSTGNYVLKSGKIGKMLMKQIQISKSKSLQSKSKSLQTKSKSLQSKSKSLQYKSKSKSLQSKSKSLQSKYPSYKSIQNFYDPTIGKNISEILNLLNTQKISNPKKTTMEILKIITDLGVKINPQKSFGVLRVEPELKEITKVQLSKILGNYYKYLKYAGIYNDKVYFIVQWPGKVSISYINKWANAINKKSLVDYVDYIPPDNISELVKNATNLVVNKKIPTSLYKGQLYKTKQKYGYKIPLLDKLNITYETWNNLDNTAGTCFWHAISKGLNITIPQIGNMIKNMPDSLPKMMKLDYKTKGNLAQKLNKYNMNSIPVANVDYCIVPKISPDTIIVIFVIRETLYDGFVHVHTDCIMSKQKPNKVIFLTNFIYKDGKGHVEITTLKGKTITPSWSQDIKNVTKELKILLEQSSNCKILLNH